MSHKVTRAPNSRSRNGCLTCRSRHIKCDETLPSCKNCVKSNKVCQRGSRLNFFKNITAKPYSLPGSHRYFKKVTFIDQSYTIHKVYKENKFHDYSGWLKNHSVEELKESDEDIQNSMDIVINDPYKNKLTLISVVHLNDYSDSEKSVSLSSEDFNLSQFISKILSFPALSVADNGIFVYSHQNSIVYHAAGLQVTQVVDNVMELAEFGQFVDYLESYDEIIEPSSQPNTVGADNSSPMFLNSPQQHPHQQPDRTIDSDFNMFLNSFIFALKTNRIELFEQTFLTCKIISFISNKMNWEQMQTYENMMLFFELLLLNLNDSLSFKKAPLIDINDEKIEYLLKKILNINLFDDLNYFLIRIFIVIMKLNNLKHIEKNLSAHHTTIRLTHIIQDLKDLENNQFLTIYFPKVANVSNSSKPATPTIKSLHPSTTATVAPKIQFHNTKTQRLHLLYNFAYVFILENFNLGDHLNSQLFRKSYLGELWSSFETDVFHRLAVLTMFTDFSNDSFMSFLKTYH